MIKTFEQRADFIRNNYFERAVVLHRGIYKRTATVGEAVFMITGMTIGAGILGLPYVAAAAGLAVGIGYLVVLGVVMLGYNLMLGSIATRARQHLQLQGLAGKYLGRWAKIILSAVGLVGGMATLLAYIIGEGDALQSLIGGASFGWSIVFWSAGSVMLWAGLERIKKADVILGATVIGLIVLLSLYLAPHFQPAVLAGVDWRQFFLPFGVVIFALHGSPAIAEAHALLPDGGRRFRRAVTLGTIIPIAVYLLFTVAVVGAMGSATTPIATVGLSQRWGPLLSVMGNLFAILAMATSFMGLGTALIEMFTWDYGLSRLLSLTMVAIIPLILFLSGLRDFIAILAVVGGVFMAIEMVIMTLVYFKAMR